VAIIRQACYVQTSNSQLTRRNPTPEPWAPSFQSPQCDNPTCGCTNSPNTPKASKISSANEAYSQQHNPPWTLGVPRCCQHGLLQDTSPP
jgi:hypothetical protein